MRAITQFSRVDASTLLAYNLSTSPSPIQVSPKEGSPSKAALTLVVNNPTGADLPTPIYLQKLVLSVPVSADSTGLVAPNTRFKAMVSPSEIWQVSDPTPDGLVTITPKADGAVRMTGDGISVVLYDITVNQTVGTTEISISEAASTKPEGPFGTSALAVRLGKFPYAFYAGDFRADDIFVNNGGQTTLRWVGSENAAYTILWETNTQNVTSQRSWMTPRLTNTTTFYLKVDATQYGETVTQYFSLTVTVANPSLVANTLEVLQGSTLNGTLLAKGQANLQGGLNVQGNSSLAAATAASLGVSGGATFGSATAGQLTATSRANLANLAVTGSFALNSPAQMISGAQAKGTGSYVAKTDGFVIAAIQAGGIDPKKKCIGWALINTGNVAFWGTGGNMVYHYSSSSYSSANNSQSYMAPVRKGATVSLSTQNGSGNKVNPNYYFWWIPIGREAAAQEESLVKVSDEAEFPADLASSLEAAELGGGMTGSGRLEGGKASVELGAGVVSVAPGRPYFVQVVPTAQCQGLAVVHKADGCFIVEELNGGTSDATFDWYLVFRE